MALRDVIPQYEREIYSNLEMGNNKLQNFTSSSKVFLYQEFDKRNNDEYLTNIFLGQASNVTIYYASYDTSWDGQTYELLGTVKPNVADYRYPGIYFTLNEPKKITGEKFLLIFEYDDSTPIKYYTSNDVKTKFSNNTITKNYSAFSGNIDLSVITVKEEELARIENETVKKIEIKTLPNKLSYLPEEQIDLTGGKLEVTLNDDSKTIIDMKDESVFFSGYTPSNTKVGTIPITVYYKNSTTTFDITIRNDVKNLEIYSFPNQKYTFAYTDYVLDLSDGQVKIVYSDDQEIIWDMTSNRFNVNAGDFSPNVPGTYTITIEYYENSVGFDVVVYPLYGSLEIAQEPTKHDYYVGEKLDLDGGLINLYSEYDELFDTIDFYDERCLIYKYLTHELINEDFTFNQPGSYTFKVVLSPLDGGNIAKWTVNVTTPEFMKGDLDKDNQITIIDVKILLQNYINSTHETAWDRDQLYMMDMDGNKIVDLIDVRMLLQKYINS